MLWPKKCRTPGASPAELLTSDVHSSLSHYVNVTVTLAVTLDIRFMQLTPGLQIAGINILVCVSRTEMLRAQDSTAKTWRLQISLRPWVLNYEFLDEF